MAEDTRYVGSLVPIRDGVMTALRIEYRESTIQLPTTPEGGEY